ncbi:unnamed protein product [Protopolystoma xenopodis]|uniref:N-acetyltransferase ESCO acetyl-transferase domain-containing protein n=1 Tax=Protopolystoma xenopodis TaxID=117903 RepID=A0A448X2K7_9PLAT|nr:unnamed protein product [Protopolystoma xenopodis]
MQQETIATDADATIPAMELPLCGVRRIWVAREHRRRGIATALLDCVLQNFAYGHSLSRSRVAFAEPTADGADFAVNFTGREDFYYY